MKIDKINETRDCIDQRWIKFVTKLDLIPIFLPNNKAIVKKYLQFLKPKLIILSGGNDIYQKNLNVKNFSRIRDQVEFELIKQGIKKNIPILGVCRGMQLLNIFYNGSISKIKNHTGKLHKIIFIEKYNKILGPNVNSFHNWGITKNNFSKDLRPIAYDANKNIEAFIHKKKKILGIMWHPERYKIIKQKDINLTKHFLKI